MPTSDAENNPPPSRKRRLAIKDEDDVDNGLLGAHHQAKRQAKTTMTPNPIPPPCRPAILPLTPLEDEKNNFISSFLSSHHNTNRETCVLYLCCAESTEAFASGLDKCKSSCSPWQKIHESCFQFDGTRHITLWTGQLDDVDVKKMIRQSHKMELPISEICFKPGWKHWNAGNYIGLEQQSEDTLRKITMNIMDGILLPGKSNNGNLSCDHLSLYRRRGFHSKAAKDAFETVRKALAQHQWGTLPVHSIRLKIIRRPYDDCKVLVEANGVITECRETLLLEKHNKQVSKQKVKSTRNPLQEQQGMVANDQRCQIL